MRSVLSARCRWLCAWHSSETTSESESKPDAAVGVEMGRRTTATVLALAGRLFAL